MNATTLGSLLVGVSGLVGVVVAFVGKRGENAVTGYSSLTDQLQEELASKRAELTEKNAHLAELAMLRGADQAEITRLRAIVIQLGGHP
ncbi:hypothetical protein [Actinacidiphila rubida]|uniref:Uncharacterized protein n=1 Tax=Actinacidiphila rubida TaxID=310780 RepID=A0A1H8SZQ5_9ACTN|nr:hypothetical protein [Actinacidiphila rubida]SEO83703.1 hypothetical protein SAMN05216267_104660 [Actinacidiphila rubida]